MRHSLASYAVGAGLVLTNLISHPADAWTATELVELAAAPALVALAILMSADLPITGHYRPPLGEALLEGWGPVLGYLLCWWLVGRWLRRKRAAQAGRSRRREVAGGVVIALLPAMPMAGRWIRRWPTPTPPPVSPAGSARPAHARLRVATYNIRYGIRDTRGMAAAADIIRQSQADVVAIQEANPELADYLARRLSDEYPHATYCSGVRAAGAGWLSRLPLLDARVLPRAAGAGYEAHRAEVLVSGRRVQIVNVHLTSTVPRPGLSLWQVLDLWGFSEDVRRREVDQMCAELSAGVPAILAGDFNSTWRMAASRRLRQLGYVDSFACLHRDAESQPTFCWGLGRGCLKSRVDYIWHSPDARTLSSHILDRGPSDHFLLVSELALDGRVRRIKGALPTAMPAREGGRRGVICPAGNAEEDTLSFGETPMKCPVCDVEMEPGRCEVRGTLLGFLMIGFSWKHLYFHGQQSGKHLMLHSTSQAAAHRCSQCNGLFLPGDDPGPAGGSGQS